jgi:hypothetical protein
MVGSIQSVYDQNQRQRRRNAPGAIRDLLNSASWQAAISAIEQIARKFTANARRDRNITHPLLLTTNR